MRWIWIDKFVEFESGKFAKAIKNISLAEEHLHDHYPGFAVMPGSLMIEGMAQTGGILLGETSQFENVVILAKVPKIIFHSWACPGDTLTYTAKLVDARPDGGIVECQAHVGSRLVADGEIVFAHLDEKTKAATGVDQKNFVFSMRLLGVMQVGRAGDGCPTSTPPATTPPSTVPTS
jgi:3-hydroxyacyl-[acyl-carrier-protein] dehydratase